MTKQEKYSTYVSLLNFTGKNIVQIERELNLTMNERFEFLKRFESENKI